MLGSLKIRNFRILENFEVSTLGRVNLIVGKNNSGKSTVLEALRIYTRQGHPSLLQEVSRAHDENYRAPRRDAPNEEEETEWAYQHFFPGREFPSKDEQPIYVGDVSGSEYVKIEHMFFADEETEVQEGGEIIRRRRRQPISKSDMFRKDLTGSAITGQGFLVTTSRSKRSGWIDMGASQPAYSSRRWNPFWDEIKETPVSYVPTQFLPFDYLASLWDSAALTENDQFIVKALTIIDDDVEGLVFVRRDSDRYPSGRGREERTAIVRLKNHRRPIPLNSMGDGMLRVLQLILALFPAKGGILLIDEFENGLHYSVQEKAWELIFLLAKRLDIQVFATTHSWDCIEAFRNVACKDADKGVLFRVGRSILKSDKGKVIATVFDEEKLANLTQAEVEVR